MGSPCPAAVAGGRRVSSSMPASGSTAFAGPCGPTCGESHCRRAEGSRGCYRCGQGARAASSPVVPCPVILQVTSGSARGPVRTKDLPRRPQRFAGDSCIWKVTPGTVDSKQYQRMNE